jgi:hypothetical protein
MNDGARKRESQSGASPLAREWAMRRAATRAAASVDRARAQQEKEERLLELEQEAGSPAALYIGLFIVLLLVVAGWIALDRLRCDPIFGSITARAARHTCD